MTVDTGWRPYGHGGGDCGAVAIGQDHLRSLVIRSGLKAKRLSLEPSPKAHVSQVSTSDPVLQNGQRTNSCCFRSSGCGWPNSIRELTVPWHNECLCLIQLLLSRIPNRLKRVCSSILCVFKLNSLCCPDMENVKKSMMTTLSQRNFNNLFSLEPYLSCMHKTKDHQV